ncbi:uncharacterized protein LOC495474 [Xenopus laevis]|uniref:Large ribosomal subunit protein bL9m n=1 Tax=Xenopus laevis TaxID=8355 RepID=Q5U4L3_XENLA|nr:uncharacterized protein LOC495474 [Xenopus laevis]AAH85049.1 LOC495474 protein [Xenopus laevis]
MLSLTSRLLLTRGAPELLTCGALCVTPSRGTVMVERWWQVNLPKEGEEPKLHPRRHRIYRVLEDTKHKKKEKMELLLTQTVPKLGGRGDTVFVEKALGRNKLLSQGLAIYPSPENKKMFEEEKRRQQEGAPEDRTQSWTGEMTVNYLQNSHLEIGMKNNVGKWEVTKEIVARNLFKSLGIVAPVEALKIPDEPITQWGEYWCEVTVNGIDTVRVPMSVVNFEKPKTKRYKQWLARQAAESAPEPES